MTSALPWPVVVTAEPMHHHASLQHPEPVITIPCPRPDARRQEPVPLSWLELLGQR